MWSAATVYVGFTSSLTVLLVCRLILGVAEGVYWPQQSRFAKAWFAPNERTKANAIIQYYGQYLALAFGFIVLTPIWIRRGNAEGALRAAGAPSGSRRVHKFRARILLPADK